ncbi:hypothetical protein A2313_04100 [Candidatus Roizmanbacteria bacterium RIFOXYB2_FULL_41_10]|nr:MAG: hypothetical protein A2377_03490 [Candidatus Roizmanbacteria bacterium RIFOXYB1_FULL_41_27]OGK66951.1 MAG: hypothetical protein A2262_01105 [Candidatus Roizmanbacteria bacterium RIFOXYA2_FULL_41_8]OGK71793.1 MAG: hypothetical protein A2313_04100 [Candidatus Roizmanbacteria bacterium RIFOXYB2_FULL_41_10]OGK72478.1 MAG: hypothetical protein A2403_04020 [Candidatus Roizmanbacteria bacterium RIFOXYC1_FULL_41_16]OGK75410.1 MAG: hypothetical protein A2459_01665 [Candidatus Roizmanbacteria bac
MDKFLSGVTKVLGILVLVVLLVAGGLFVYNQVRVASAPVAQTVLVSGQTDQTGSNAGLPANDGGQTGQRELTGEYSAGPARTWADWPADRINPEENLVRDTGETNWEDLTDLEWLWPDGTTSVGTRRVDANGQKFGILLSEGPFGLTGKQVIEMLLKNVNDRSWVVRATPEGQSSGGWWTIELLKPGASESAIPGLLVPSSGKVVTWTLQKGRTDYWGGFPAPVDPKGVCEAKKLVDADSGLNQWQVVCREGGSATIKSDGVTWMPAVMYFDDFTGE